MPTGAQVRLRAEKGAVHAGRTGTQLGGLKPQVPDVCYAAQESLRRSWPGPVPLPRFLDYGPDWDSFCSTRNCSSAIDAVDAVIPSPEVPVVPITSLNGTPMILVQVVWSFRTSSLILRLSPGVDGAGAAGVHIRRIPYKVHAVLVFDGGRAAGDPHVV